MLCNVETFSDEKKKTINTNVAYNKKKKVCSTLILKSAVNDKQDNRIIINYYSLLQVTVI